MIEFKFLLQDSLGKFHWQNGPNRTLQTGETTKTLVVYEDWGNAKNQKVAEEGDAPVQMMEAVVNDDHCSNGLVSAHELQVCDNQEIKVPDAPVPIPWGGAFGRVRVTYGGQGLRRVGSDGLAGTAGRLRVLVTALPKPLEQLVPTQEGVIALAPEVCHIKIGIGLRAN